jgi:cell division protease FtsH
MLGQRVLGHDQGLPFLGRYFWAAPDYSYEIARDIDDEIRRIVEAAHQRAKDLLTEHRETLDTVSEILIRRETIEKGEFEALLLGTPEAEVFPDAAPELPAPAAPADKPGQKAPRTLPRPGLAGGVEVRADEPRKPEL